MPTLRLRVELLDVPRPVVRILDIPVETTLFGLHLVLQAAFSWRDEEPHAFTRGASSYLTGLPEHGVYARDLLVRLGDELMYTYDFGDEWRHRIRLVGTDRRLRKRATLVDGHGTSPLEDCGGAAAWASILGDIDLAAAGEFHALTNPEAYHATFGEVCPREVQRDFAAFEEWEKDFAVPAVKKVNVRAEPKASRSEGALDASPAVIAVLTAVAEEEGVLGALGAYFDTPLLTEMIRLHEAAPRTELSDVHAKRLGRTLTAVLRTLLRARTSPEAARELAGILGLCEGRLAAEMHGLEKLYHLADIAELSPVGLVATEETRRLLAFRDIDFVHELLARLRNLRGERLVIAVLAFCYLAYSGQACAHFERTRLSRPFAAHERFFDDIGTACFPQASSVAHAADELCDRMRQLSDPLHLIAPRQEHPLRNGHNVTNPALVAFAREFLADLDPQSLQPRELVEERR